MKHIKKESDGTAGSRNHGTVREGAAYLVFGVLTTLIDYVISNGLFYLAHMDPVPAQSIAWAAAVLFAFVTNKWWVWKPYPGTQGRMGGVYLLRPVPDRHLFI